MTYLLLLAIGFALLLTSLRLQEEILVITSTLTGVGFLVWGFALTPTPLQIGVEILLILVAFPACIRCIIISKVNTLLGKANVAKK
ncbi:hypothetical protein [Almyronema epifaneia]|uniref:Uncharacterized protein n=1 Tax=Almyronema epifaneia S1 TaxID=2991925 RepID=A0ABW6I9K4_9CYAN